MLKRIVFISPSLQQGGLENAISVMANWLNGQGYKVTILTIYNAPIFYSLHGEIEVVKPDYYRSSHSFILFYLRTLLYLRRQLRNRESTVVVSYGDFLNPISVLATFGTKQSLFISDRSSPGKKFPWPVQRLRELTYGQATGIIAQTQRAADQKRSMLKRYKNIHVIPNPVRPIQPQKLEREKVVLGVGRHYKVKGLDRLIRSFAKINDPEWELHIAGATGPQTKELEELAVDLGVSTKLKFLGAVKDIDRVYSYSGIFVLPSRSEGFPNALIEAMAHGLPCISFDINAGPADIIDQGKNGLLVPDGDIDALASAMRSLMRDPGKCEELGKEAQNLREELCTEKIGQTFLRIIQGQ